MEKKITNNKKIYLLAQIALIILFVLQFILHRKTPFMKDDFWYATNLTTGEPVSGLKDIIQSQIWHYHNWGGRIVNHGLLQAVLASGELWADIFNITATFLLGLVICLFCDNKNVLFFLLAESLIVAFNPSIFYSMYWESGSVNYLYSSIWILFYVFLVIRELDEKEHKKLKGIELWILPLSLITGWSTENMGPSCFVLTAFAVFYLKIKKKKIPLWLFEGTILTLIGSIMLILAPGNFVRNQFMEELTWKEMIVERTNTILETSFQTFLFPSFLFAVIILTMEIAVLKIKLTVPEWTLFGFAALSQLVLFLSPAYPQRTSFGIMVTLISFFTSAISKIYDKNQRYRCDIMIIIFSFYLYAVYIVIRDMNLPNF